jgi:hypothetical protein
MRIKLDSPYVVHMHVWSQVEQVYQFSFIFRWHLIKYPGYKNVKKNSVCHRHVMLDL